MTPNQIRLKPAHERPAPDDGARVLVDRRWPEDLPRRDADLALWLQSVAPSARLRQRHEGTEGEPDRWSEFRASYREELEDRTEELRRLEEIARRSRLTLVSGAADEERHPAQVLKAVLEERLAEG